MQDRPLRTKEPIEIKVSFIQVVVKWIHEICLGAILRHCVKDFYSKTFAFWFMLLNSDTATIEKHIRHPFIFLHYLHGIKKNKGKYHATYAW